MLQLQRVWLNAPMKITEVESGLLRQAHDCDLGFLGHTPAARLPRRYGRLVVHDGTLMAFALVRSSSVLTSTGLPHRESTLGGPEGRGKPGA